MTTPYLKLTGEQISVLESNGCTAEDWGRVMVRNGFDTAFVRNVRFGGDVLAGAITSGVFADIYGISKQVGLYNAAIYNCTIGDNVYISNIGGHISNYDIADRVVIENAGMIACIGKTAFGNGAEVASINEAGGREVPIYDHLTSQVAYIIAMYRHRPETIKRLGGMISGYAAAAASDRGFIGAGSILTNCKSVINVKIGARAVVDGAASLREGTINSTDSSPSKVGVGVIASDFIMACSSRVDTGSMLRRCFVGEGTIFENGFSAENSLFFANCHCNHGEACAVFAGPYTVTHHRSTLLIAGYFSFFNAGSGANQSNHMYKSGPVHQGIHLRGCKFGSDAYIMLPARTGAFSIVTGRHYSHYDTAEMPFSFIVDEEESSHLIPAANIRGCGIARDIKKWPARDKRYGVASDIINFDLMTPYTGGRILRAIEICEMLAAKYPTVDTITWNRIRIKMTRLKRGLTHYKQTLRSYVARLFTEKGASLSGPYMPHGNMEGWVDMAGMIAPKILVTQLLDDIDNGKLDSLPAIEEALRNINAGYDTYVNDWAVYAISAMLGKNADKITDKELAAFIKEGEKDGQAIAAAIELDAKRDAAPLMSIGYGIDSSDEGEIASDFADVRGL